ncbi:hypothetical protein Tco_0032629 [Tanacetum coccineum]
MLIASPTTPQFVTNFSSIISLSQAICFICASKIRSCIFAYSSTFTASKNQQGNTIIPKPWLYVYGSWIGIEHQYISKDLMGRVKELESLTNLKSALSNKGFADLSIRYLGELWVLLEFSSAESMELFQKNEDVVLQWNVVYLDNLTLDESVDIEHLCRTTVLFFSVKCLLITGQSFLDFFITVLGVGGIKRVLVYYHSEHSASLTIEALHGKVTSIHFKTNELCQLDEFIDHRVQVLIGWPLETIADSNENEHYSVFEKLHTMDMAQTRQKIKWFDHPSMHRATMDMIFPRQLSNNQQMDLDMK